ncbi:MAG: heavy-metal-associated domain-containing protein, partial [Flavobacterium sp.]|nr:heavy-metal-associated domain-containing protein [Flavobacterium sp.]
MNKTIFNITKMDCPSEEQLIRMKLQNLDTVKSLEFDIPNRKLDVYHNENPGPILSALEALNLNTTLISTEESQAVFATDTNNKQRKLLWA